MDELDKAQQLLVEISHLAESRNTLSKVCQKLSRKVKADVQFLEKLKSKTKFDGSHVCIKNRSSISSSNIPYLTGVLDVVQHSEDVQDVICDMRKYGIIVDVVCDGGKTWKKVIARNPQSLHLIWAGKGQYGTKDLVKKVEKYLQSAKKYSEMSPPRVVCIFCNGVTHEMAEALELSGISVEGKRVDVSQDVLDKLFGVFGDSSSDSEDEEVDTIPDEPLAVDDRENQELFVKIQKMPADQKIFLDITTMLVYISDVCNGGCNFEFTEKVLAEQARAERQIPALSVLQPYMNGRKLVTCQSALHDFWSIVNIMGGEEEKRRAHGLEGRLTVVPDIMSSRFTNIVESGQIRGRSKSIFGTADFIKCEILTSNEGFVRAAAAQDIHISAVLHQPRALSERKRAAEAASKLILDSAK